VTFNTNDIKVTAPKGHACVAELDRKLWNSLQAPIQGYSWNTVRMVEEDKFEN